MTMNDAHTTQEPTRTEVDALAGAALLEFGTPTCGYCRGAQPLIAASLSAHPAVRHIKVEDGPGKPLGRSFGVRLWPTLIFLRDGKEVARIVRTVPKSAVDEALTAITASAGATGQESAR
jgi:thioredoxin 1